MKSIIYITFSIFLFSCGKTYVYQKVVMNDTNKNITVYSSCCGNENNEIMIPSGEKKIVFECGYQSYKKPNCSDVKGKFSIKKELDGLNDINNPNNWTYEEEGKIIRCIYTIENTLK